MKSRVGLGPGGLGQDDRQRVDLYGVVLHTDSTIGAIYTDIYGCLIDAEPKHHTCRCLI